MIWKIPGICPRAVLTIAIAATLLASCAATPKTGPDLVGKVASQPGNCFYRDAGGNVFIALCK